MKTDIVLELNGLFGIDPVNLAVGQGIRPNDKRKCQLPKIPSIKTLKHLANLLDNQR